MSLSPDAMLTLSSRHGHALDPAMLQLDEAGLDFLIHPCGLV